MRQHPKSRMVVLAASLVLAPITSQGVEEEEMDGCWTEFPHCVQIDDTQVESLEVVVGRIISISKTPLCSGQEEFVTLALKSARFDNTLEVFLGPEKFLRHNGMVFAVGDEVTVMGVSSWNTLSGELTVVQVEKGSKALFLRDPNGRPLWLDMRPAS